jgi:nucleoside-diphosphate-sugar epimerase
MALHVIVGAGAVGGGTARLLAEQGHRVRVVTRSGGGPRHAGIELVAADAADAAALRRAAEGADALYNVVNPPYHRWLTDWPPLAASMLGAAEATGAVLVTMSNLYAYGPPTGPMTETDPLASSLPKARMRATMWQEALAAHEDGRVRVTEARASDYFGPGALDQSHLGARFVPRLLRGKTVWVFGDPDMPHTWTYVPDIARVLVTLGTDERAWGRAWHVPSVPPLTYHQIAGQMARLAGVPTPAVRGIPRWAVQMVGLAVPLIREIPKVLYQFERPFVMDSSAFTSTFGVAATPMEEALRTTVEYWRDRERAAA